MTEEPPQSGKIRCGDATLDLLSGEIERAGVRERLPDQVVEVLRALSTRPGTLVTREELVARLWPKTTYIDTDAGLNSAIKKLRAALGDDADHPRFIETLPRRGYRLVAPIEQVVEPSVQTAPPPGAPQPVRRAAFRKPLVVGILIAGAVLVAELWTSQQRNTVQTPSDHAVPTAEAPNRNVAVMPFLNLTGDTRQEYLALGLADNVLHQLAQFHDINVIARTSSFSVAAGAEDVRDIGRKLNARYILEGSLQSSMNHLRVTTQLIDASTGVHVWSKSFDRRPDDFFALQDEISIAVARALELSVSPAQNEPLQHSGTQNVDAWLAFQQGRALVATRKYADLRTAVDNLERAVQIDPRYAAAFAELGQAYLLRAAYAPALGATETHAAMRQAANNATEAANQALAIDPSLGDALIARGAAANSLDDHSRAEKDLRAGLALAPNSARGLQQLGELLVEQRGNTDEGLALLQRASALDPLEPRGPYYRGFVELRRGNASEAERLLLAALQLRPDYAPALTRLSTLKWELRAQFADAIKYGELALRADPEALFVRDNLVAQYLELGEMDAADNLLPASAETRHTSSEVLLLAGNARDAAARIYAYPERFLACDWYHDAYIVLDHARVTRNFKTARRFLEERTGIIATGGSQRVNSGAENVATVVAELLTLSGDERNARSLLDVVLRQLDGADRPASGNCVNVSRTRARTLALLGRDAEALVSLERALLRDKAWYHGWYLFDHDAAYARLRGHPQFESLHTAYRQLIGSEREKLRQFRLSGLVPKRP